ncbi:GNAT family N-acetyltransferase [Flavobacterium xinjiangense]|jgi:dTDP-4-amino-4,6-dideoxy-D-galactose acyltransferase|uniref:dTDP-4-amino-4,6-dideoxy-D-galactose acyltransferase n=1 Tax=Flavobacterium xinjiangense TaxID=178356 RepID=A0A1M7MRS9_9FLAO|nr:GNAT family N-acetyltransferase [Flavobacterium xinjiangense]SHM93791.1 dTDP-4-amino-4,6-dideoxy-D-galactose acyltransferase [Flavobacterium xinjiangense]
MSRIERLEWDSSFFGYEVGKIVANDTAIFGLNDFIERTKEFKLIYLFSKQSISLPNITLVDTKVVLSQVCTEIVAEDNVLIQSFNSKKHCFAELKELALESGIYSRFYIDKNFRNQEYEKLYTRWIENAVNDAATFDIIIAIRNNAIIGFATLNKKNSLLADIGLVAVSKNSRGLGVGKQLIQEGILRSKIAGFTEIQVVTQMNNVAAMKLYQSANFKIKEITNIYHLWNP